VPYDAEVAYAIRYMKDNLEENSSPAAVELAKDEHQAIVAALSEKAPLKATQGDAVMSLSALYDSAMELAFWQRYAGDADGATTTVTEIDSALPPDSPMLAGDVTQIAAVRLRYGLLGAKMPKLEPMRSLESTTAKAATAKSEVATGDGALTVLVLFPDWCGGCRKMMKPLTEFAKANKETRIRAFGLVFLDDSVIPSPAGHEQLLKELKGTSTLVVPPSTVQTLGANEFPLGVVLDREGRVRFIGVLPVNGFNGDGFVEKTILKIVGRDQGAKKD
jgi:thiol-disulfide isomerase/thioredoxin